MVFKIQTIQHQKKGISKALITERGRHVPAPLPHGTRQSTYFLHKIYEISRKSKPTWGRVSTRDPDPVIKYGFGYGTKLFIHGSGILSNSRPKPQNQNTKWIQCIFAIIRGITKLKIDTPFVICILSHLLKGLQCTVTSYSEMLFLEVRVVNEILLYRKELNNMVYYWY